MEPDPDSPFQRVERTLISVWCYITEAVSRFLRPQPAETANNNPTSSHEHGVDSEPPDCSQKGADARAEEAGEEQFLSTVSLLSSSSPVVAWERCTADIDVKPEEKDHDIIEEQLSQTGNDHAGQLVTEGAKARQGRQEKAEIEKCDTCEESEMPEKDGERATLGSGHVWLKEGVSDGMDSSEEEEHVSTIRLEDCRKVVETLAGIEEDDGEETEEGSEGGNKIQEGTPTKEVEDNNKKTGDQRDNKASASMLGDANICDASQLSAGDENCSDEKTRDVETKLKELPEDELTDENVQMIVFKAEDLNTAANHQTTGEESEQDQNRRTGENILIQSVTTSKDVQNTEPDTTKLTFREEDVLVTIMQTAEEDVTMEEISADVDYKVAEDEKLSAENENSAERAQVETQHLVCKELSGVAEEERVQDAVVEDLEPSKSATCEEAEQKKSSRAVEDVRQEENLLTQSVTSSEDDQDTEEEQFVLTGNNREEHLINEDMTAHQFELEKTEIQTLRTCTERDGVENKDQEDVKSETTANKAICEELEKRGEEAVAEEKLVSRNRLDDFPKVDAAKEDLEDEADEIQEDDGKENEEDFKEDSEVKQCTINEDSDEETGEHRGGEAVAMMLGDSNVNEDASLRSSENENCSDEKTKDEETQLPVCRELSEDEKTDENVQMTVFEEKDLNTAENYQTTEESEQDKSRRTIKEENREDLEEQRGEIQEDDREKNEVDFEEESGIKQCTSREEEDSNEEAGEQREGEAAAVMLGDANICEDASQLSSENENSGERTPQVEAKHLVCKELSGVAEDERVQVAVIEEEEPNKSATNEEAEQKKNSRAVEDVRQEENLLTQNVTSSEDDQGKEEGQFGQTDHLQAGHDCPKVDEAKEDLEEECSDIQEDDGEENEEDFEEESEVKQEEESETSENDGERATGGSGHMWLKEGVSDGIESSEPEEHMSTERLDDCQKTVETLMDIEEENEEEAEAEESKIQESTPTKEEEEDSNLETEEQRDNKTGMLGDANISEDASQLSSENGNCSDEKTKDLDSQLPVCKALPEDELTSENVQMTVFEEEDLNTVANHQTTEEELEQDKSRTTVEEEKTEPDTTEFTFKEEDVLVMIMQTTTEEEVTVEEISADVDNEVAEVERLSTEVTDKESCIERDCTTTPVTIKAEGESAREINRGFNNIPPGVIEGQAALSHELNTEACEETPKAVPEHNNELKSDENTRQRFLEGGNAEETPTIHLPEEVEVFKSSRGGGGEYLLIRQGSTEESKNKLDLVVKEQVGALQFVEDTEKPKSDDINLKLDHFSEEEKVELLDTSMKTEIKQLDEEFETYSADETELQDEDETVELETTRLSKEAAEDGCERREVLAADEGVDSADETPESPKGEEEKMTEISLGPELVQSFSLEDDRGNLKHSEEIRSKLFDEIVVELPQVRFDTEEQGCTDEGQLDHEILDLNEITPLQLVGTAADLITGQSELSQHLEANNQAPLRAPQMTEAEITTDTETADDSKTAQGEGPPLISTEEIIHEPQPAERYSEDPAEEHQDVIDEEILDLWIETAMSKDRFKEEDQPEPALQKDQFNEESDETSSERKKEGEMEAISEELVSISETETTLDSEILDLPFSETQIIKTEDTGLLPNINDNSEGICEFSSSNSEFALTEETVETLQSHPTEEGASSEIRSCPDSGVSSPEPRHPNQECGTVQEKSDETKSKTEAETDAVCGDNEETDVTSLIAKAEGELLEVSDISDEIQIPGSGQHTEAVLEEKSVLTESPSGGEPQIEPEKQHFPLAAPEHRWSEDLIKSFPAPSRTEVEEDRSQVDGTMLDFAVQRSRIAVKNPRARPPTDPRSLIHKPSVDPTPSLPVPGKVPAGVPLGGLGIGIKLPGIGAGFPVLKKTRPAPKDEDNPETQSQESEEKKEEEEKSDAAKKDEAPKRPKWMPPGQPGFGNPLMSELRTKLKKTPKE